MPVTKHFIFVLALLGIPSIANAGNLPVPFTPQAPSGNWNQPWQDACEETSILMVDAFYGGRSLPASRASTEILRLLRIKEGVFGTSLDESADTVTDLINRFFPWEARVVEHPSLADLKAEIDAGHPVILPVYGKGLLNPHFVNGGPYYHMNVLSGYDDERQEFIVQEPGTHLGLDFRYSYATILDAMHDYLPNQGTPFGRKVAIFTKPHAETSLSTDGDNDGLTKADELRFGTVLWLRDSDGDGQADGEEVLNGFSPTKANQTLLRPMLIKSPDDPKVYLVENKEKRHIANEAVFLGRGWQWNQLMVISEELVELFEAGEEVYE